MSLFTFLVLRNIKLLKAEAYSAPQYAVDSTRDRAAHLAEHVSQVVLRIHPGGYSITEEDEVLNTQEERRRFHQKSLQLPGWP